MSEPTTRDVIAGLRVFADNFACPGTVLSWSAITNAIAKLEAVAEAEERERPGLSNVMAVAGDWVRTSAGDITRAEFDELKRRVDACERGK